MQGFQAQRTTGHNTKHLQLETLTVKDFFVAKLPSAQMFATEGRQEEMQVNLSLLSR